MNFTRPSSVTQTRKTGEQKSKGGITVSEGVLGDYFQSVLELPNLTGTPERNLLVAVLERALLDYVGNDVRESETAAEWLFEEGDNPSYEEFTFSWICQELDLDYRKIAARIKRLPKRGERRIAPWYFDKSCAQAAG